MAPLRQQSTTSEADGFGSDSFLDIVANIVGILIILVMVVGLRAGRRPALPMENAATAEEMAEVRTLAAKARTVERDVLELADEIQRVAGVAETRFRERAKLAYLVRKQQKDLNAMESGLHAAARSRTMREREADDALREIAAIEQEIDFLSQQDDRQTIVVASLPTPLSSAVDGEELHFQLRNGRLAAIPLEELLDRFKQDAKQRIWKLRTADEMTETVGPVDGFRLRYTMQKMTVRAGRGTGVPQIGSYAQLARWTLIPVSAQLGEPMESALQQGSQLDQRLAAAHPRDRTVTVWVYPDSFREFRELKVELHRRGFSTAARPLPNDTPIGGSPSGTKSHAQ